jgi:sugar phosphate isomerase/epimerase
MSCRIVHERTRTMKVSLHSVSYSGTVTLNQATLSVEAVMRKAAQLGFDGITLAAKRPHALPLDLSPEDRARIRDLAAELGLEIVCMAGYNDFCDPSAFNREINLAYVVECIKLARDLGALIVRTFASGMGAYHREATLSQQIQWAIELAREAAQVAEEMSVTLVLQNHSPIGNDVYNVLEIVEAVGSPAYQAAIDCPLLTDSGVDYAEALRACRDILAFTTAGDFQYFPGAIERVAGGQMLTRREIGVPLGEGACDWPPFLALLKEVGYDFWINYEMCSRMRGGGSEENLDRIASASLDYLRQFIADIYGP